MNNNYSENYFSFPPDVFYQSIWSLFNSIKNYGIK